MPSPNHTKAIVAAERRNLALRAECDHLKAHIMRLEQVILEMGTIAQAGLLTIKNADERRDAGFPEANPANDESSS